QGLQSEPSVSSHGRQLLCLAGGLNPALAKPTETSLVWTVLQARIAGERAMRCAKCGYENPGGMKFCGQCTAALALICPKCRSENPPEFKFCGQCTMPLMPGMSRAGSAKSPVA